MPEDFIERLEELEEDLDIDFSQVWVGIPTGGKGTRLRPFSEDVPKPLVPFINYFPISEFIIYLLANIGARNFFFGVTGQMIYSQIFSYYQGGSGWSGKMNIEPQVNFEYQNPNIEDKGNAHSTATNIRNLGIQLPLIIVQGDNLFDPRDIESLYRFAIKEDKPFVVGLTSTENPENYGVAMLEQDGKTIKGFVEKPAKGKATSNLINTGIYVIKPEIVERLEGDFGKDTIPELVREGLVVGYEFKHPWRDLGCPQKHLDEFLNTLLHPDENSWFFEFLGKISSRVKGTNVWIRGTSDYSLSGNREIEDKIRDGRIQVEGTVIIGRDCKIGDGVKLSYCSVGDQTIIEPNVTIQKSNIMDGWYIGKGSEVRYSMLGRGGTVGESSIIEETYLGNDSSIGNKVRLEAVTGRRGTRIPDGQILHDVDGVRTDLYL